MLKWILNNKDWIFSGIGVSVIAGLMAWVARRKNKPTQKQSSGSGSVNIQAGRDIDIGPKT